MPDFNRDEYFSTLIISIRYPSIPSNKTQQFFSPKIQQDKITSPKVEVVINSK
jgi:hypothetical protein